MMTLRFTVLASVLALALTGFSLGLAPSATAHPGYVCGGLARTPCGAHETCRVSRPVRRDKMGRCVVVRPKREVMCNMIYQPVCGRDGKTYGNRCQARGGGTSVSHVGKCVPTIHVSIPSTDPAGVHAPNPPTPTPPPDASQTMCPMIYIPVCGADGKTYPNECHATRAGTKVSHTGAC